MDATSTIAISGMNAAQASLQATAQNIANLGVGSYRRLRVDQAADVAGGTSTTTRQSAVAGDAPETDMVGLLQAKNAFLANLSVFKTRDRMTGALLDTLG